MSTKKKVTNKSSKPEKKATKPLAFCVYSVPKQMLDLDAPKTLDVSKKSLIGGIASIGPKYRPSEIALLVTEGLISKEAARSHLGFDESHKPVPDVKIASKPIAVRTLVDGSVENLYSNGTRLIVPKEPIVCNSFSDLPDPFKTIEFSAPYESLQSDCLDGVDGITED